jgi:p-aminobenzoyl-glutamate transporter AbgT
MVHLLKDMVKTLKEHAALGSVLISVLSFMVSMRSCAESHNSRLVAEGSNRANVLPS